MTDRGHATDNVDDKLTFAVLKKVQQRLHGTEQRVEVVESELLAFRELQLSMLKDLQRICQLLGRHQRALIGRPWPCLRRRHPCGGRMTGKRS